MTGKLRRIQEAAEKKAYAMRPHAVSHMLAEGFTEKDIVTAYIPRRPFWETPYRRGKKKR
jgi:hypothetical protein